MNKIFLALIISILAISPSFARYYDELDKKFGFRDATCESPITNFKGLTQVEKGDNLKFYSRKGENLALGKYNMKKITYGFYKGRLSTIMIEVKGYLNSTGILSVLQKAYGDGYQSNEYIERYTWFGEKVSMSYEKNSVTNDSDIFIYCKEISNQQKEDEEAEDSKATKDL